MQKPAAERYDEFDVVVAGAGPSGLLLASELALGGVKVLVLERLAALDQTIKAGGIGALASEALERRGLGPAMAEEESRFWESMQAMMKSSGADNPVGRALSGQAAAGGMRKIGGHFAGLLLIDQSRQREPERRFRGVGQQALERLLNEHAHALGVQVRREHALLDFAEDGTGITLDVEPANERPYRLRARWLVGCDGGRSLVRKRAGFEFPGTEPSITGHQAIVELDHPERLLPLGWRRTPRGMLAYGPIPGRILLVEYDGPPSDRDAPITTEELTLRLRRVSGADVTVLGIKTATRFTDNARQATTYRRGRVLLAGDAAHVHSPFGGQGLNLGLVDAVNLGWKLVAEVRGWAPPDLLDSYSRERHPVAAGVLETTRAQVALMRPDALTSALRQVVTELMLTDEGNRFFGELMRGLRTRYDLGSSAAEVGTLTPNLPLSDERTLFDCMRDQRSVFVDAGDTVQRALVQRWPARVRVVRGPQPLLVRPDGCVAWSGAAEDTSALGGALERWCGAPEAA